MHKSHTGISDKLTPIVDDSYFEVAVTAEDVGKSGDKIVRARGTPWVPAVLRYNAVPAKILVEVCNLGNREDLELIQTRAFRQQVAEALVDGILLYYGASPAGTQPAVAAGG